MSTTLFEKKRASNTISYANGTFRILSPVPKTLCDIITKTFTNSTHRRFAFALASHVLGRGGEGLCPTTLLVNLPGSPDNNSSRAKLTSRCLAFLDRSTYKFDLNDPSNTETNKAYVYRLKAGLDVVIANEPLYRTLTDYKRNHAWQPDQTAFFEADFTQRIRELNTTVNYDASFLQAMERLSARQFIFDKAGALADPEIRGDSESRKDALRLPNGRFTTSYRLQLSGRVGTYSALDYFANVQGVKKSVRKHFQPPEGYIQISFDYVAQEPHLLAYLTEDRVLQEALQGTFYEDIKADLDLPDRATAKMVFNSIAYGQEGWGLAAALYNTADPLPTQTAQATQYIKAIRQKFPAVVAWCKQKAKEIKRSRQAISVDGTIRRHFKLKDEDGTLGLNCSVSRKSRHFRAVEMGMGSRGGRVRSSGDGLLSVA